MEKQQYLFCVHVIELVHIHDHYHCPICFTNVLPCCDGDNCSTHHLPVHFDDGLTDKKIMTAGSLNFNYVKPCSQDILPYDQP